MKLVGKKGLSGALEVLMWLLMAVTAAALILLPWVVDQIIQLNANAAVYRTQYLVTLGVSGVMALMVLWQARGILHNVNTGTIFSMQTVHRMKVLGVEFLVMALFYVGVLVFGMLKFTLGLLALVFLVAGLIVLVFSELFKQATAYKKENDMTI